MKWEDLRADQMAEAVERSGGLCLFPLGCLEKHGYHLPLGTDSLRGKAAVEAAAELADVMVFPTGMWLGDMIGSKSEPVGNNHGAISLNPHTLITVVEELLDEIARNGFRKILIIRCHGGNSSLISYIMRSHFDKKRDYALMSTAFSDSVTKNPVKMYEYLLENRKDYPMLGDEEFAVLKKFADLGKWGGGHGDFVETAQIYGCRPELVEPKHFEVANGLHNGRDHYLTKELEVEIAGAWSATHPHSYNGYDPVGCNRAIGEAFFKYAVERFAKIARVLKEDEKCIDIQRSLYEKVESPV